MEGLEAGEVGIGLLNRAESLVWRIIRRGYEFRITPNKSLRRTAASVFQLVAPHLSLIMLGVKSDEDYRVPCDACAPTVSALLDHRLRAKYERKCQL